MNSKPIIKTNHPILLYCLTIAAGIVLSVVLHQLWLLETRYFVAVIVAITLISLSAFFIQCFSDFLLICFFFSIPLTGFSKYFFVTSLYDVEMRGIIIYSGTIGLGLPDILLTGLYFMWFVRIFILRTDVLPHPEKTDILVLLLIFAYLISIPGTPDKAAAVFALCYLLRFALVYLYITRNFESRHIRWLIIAFFVAVFLEAGLAIFQYLTGKLVGLAMDRGAGLRLNEQYLIPGIEHHNRATGTCMESHTFGLYMAMLGQFAFVVSASHYYQKKYSFIGLVLFVFSMLSVLISFSRSSWLSCLIALLAAWFVHIFLWKEKRILTPTVILGFIAILLSPWILDIVVGRFDSTGLEMLTNRFKQFPVAWNIWSDHFLFGFGVGNYMEALKIYNVRGALGLPVHNVFLWLGAEAGIFGVAVFFGLIFTALVRTWKIVREKQQMRFRPLALAVFCALMVYLLDGLTDPLYREPVAYMTFWVLLSLSVSLAKMEEERV